MTTQQIGIFLDVAASGSFTMTAERLYLSQPTVSRQISRLEKEVGFALFGRRNNYLVLTAEGEMLANVFQKMGEDFQREIQKIEDISGGNQGKLRLEFTSDISIPDELIRMVNSFKNTFPKIEVTYHCNPQADIVSELRKGTIDIILAHDMELSSMNFLDSMCIAEGKRGLYYSVLHPLASKKDLNIRDFANEVNLGSIYANTDRQRSSLKEITDFYGMPEFRTKYYSNTGQLMFYLRLGQGISIMDSFVLQSVSEDIRIIPVDDSLSTVKKSLFWDKDNHNPAVLLFCNMVREMQKKRKKMLTNK